MFCYVWQYRVQKERVGTFLEGYGPDGEWVRFFGRDPGYLRTELLRDRDDPSRFVTIDYWTSAEACSAFRQRWKEEFESIDARYERVTDGEEHFGDFDL